MRELYQFAEAVTKYFQGDKETLRQAIEFRGLPVLVKFTGRGVSTDSENLSVRGKTRLAQWFAMTADDGTHGLNGYFFISSGFALRVIEEQSVDRPNLYLFTGEDCEPWDSFSVWADDAIGARDFWFRTADLDAMMAAPRAIEAAKPGRLRADREENLLRVIAGLWALSGLPPEHNTTADKLSALFDSWKWDKPAKSSMADTILKPAANLPGAVIRTSD